MSKRKEMHESNDMFQVFQGKTVARIDYFDDFDEGISVVFTDGSVLTINERMQAGMIDVSASVCEDDMTIRIAREKDRYEL